MCKVLMCMFMIHIFLSYVLALICAVCMYHNVRNLSLTLKVTAAYNIMQNLHWLQLCSCSSTITFFFFFFLWICLFCVFQIFKTIVQTGKKKDLNLSGIEFA